jgi:hypothetical protein
VLVPRDDSRLRLLAFAGASARKTVVPYAQDRV